MGAIEQAATIQEVHLWFRSRFTDYRRRGLVPQREVDAYNRAHPDRPYVGPVLDPRPIRSSWSMAQARPNAAQAEHEQSK